LLGVPAEATPALAQGFDESPGGVEEEGDEPPPPHALRQQIRAALASGRKGVIAFLTRRASVRHAIESSSPHR
jgi:hypothetical protein